MMCEVLTSVRKNEAHEILAQAHCSGTQMADRTAAWLNGSWWPDGDLPVVPVTGKPLLTDDLMLHAGAVTSITYWERLGNYEKLVVQVGSAANALQRFIERVQSRDVKQYTTDEGDRLSRKVADFERNHLVPNSFGFLETGPHSLVFQLQPPDSDALESLAELLLEYCHIAPEQD